MKKRVLFSFVIILMCVSSAFAQSTTFPCGFDIVHKQKLRTDPIYDSVVNRLNNRWIKYATMMSSASLTYTSSGYVYEIPMVVHVLHTGDTVGSIYNPDSTKIAQLVDYLNKAYAAVSPFPDTTSGGCRIPLKFVLAKRTPTGGTTNGIVRVNASTLSGYTSYGANAATTSGVDPQVIMNFSRWNPADYFNVYCVNKIDGNDLYSTGGIAGFAYFPGYPSLDGMIVAASQVKSGSTTVAHEFGHAFSLYHTFEGDDNGTACPRTDSCTITGDLICDTEPHIRESSAYPSTWCPPTGATNACTGLPYNNVQYNIMDYTTCPPNRFTAGQRTRVLNTLNNERTGFKTSLGLVAPTSTIVSACTPTATNPGYNIGPYIVDFNGNTVWTGDSYAEAKTYIDHAYTQQSFVTRGSSYTINVTTMTNKQIVKVFVDYNNDGDFADAGEAVFSHSGTISGTEVHSGTITIPATATTCKYLRMRVVADFISASVSDYACGPYVYGQAEDYAIYVRSDTPTVTTPVTLCLGSTASALTATGTSLKWYTVATGGTGSSTAPAPSTASTGSTIYYVSQSGDSSSTCESNRTPITVNVTSTVSAPTVTSPVNYCLGGASSALTATGTGLLWYNSSTGGTGSSVAPTPSTSSAGTTTYYVSQTSGGCESPRASITVNVTSTVSAPTVTSPVNYCVGSSSSALTASGTGLLWYSASTGGTGSSTAFTPSTSSAGTTTYYVSQTSGGCESPRTSITVNVNAIPSAPTVTSPVNYCVGATASALSASGTSLLWYTTATGGSGALTAITPTTTTAGTTTYYVTQTASGCESPRAAITVNINALPSAPTVTSPVNYCVGATASALSASGSSLLWYTGATGGTGSATAFTPSTSPAGTTTYYVSQTTSGCESPRASITVNVGSTVSAPTVTSPVNYCVGGTASALSASGSSLLWYTGATGGTGSSTAFTPSTLSAGTTTYYVSQTSGSCESPRASITVNVNALPTISGTLNACVGVSTTLTGSASADTTTPWASSDTTVAKISKTGIVTGIASGSATITYKNQNGCTVTATFTVNALPAALSVTTPVTYCQDATTSALTAPTGTSIKWYTVATGGTSTTTAPTPSSTVPGIIPYYVTQTNGSGCESTPRSIINVVINPKPASVAVTASVTSLCNGDSVVLNGSSSIFNGFGSTSFLNGTAASGATAVCDCPNGSVAVGYEGGTGSWIDHFDLICKPIDRFGTLGTATTATTANGFSSGPTYVGPYLFSGTGMLVGMKARDESATSPNYLGEITGYGQNASYITALGDNTSGASSLSAIGGLAAASNLGTVWAPNGTVITGMYTYNPTSFYAAGVSLRYTPIGAFKYNYSWSTGDTNKNITVKTTGTYTLTVTNSLGCAASSTPLTITVNPLPTITGTLNACVGLTSTLTGSATASPTAPWTSSDTTIAKVSSAGVVTGIVAGTATITYKNSNGCNTSVSFTVNGLPGTPTVTTPVTYCQGATATVLSATKANPADTLYWYNSATGGTGSTVAPTPSTTASGTTLYYVSERNASKCDGARAAITVNVNPTPVAPVVVSPVNYCQGVTATALSATKATSTDTLLWYNSATGGTAGLSAPTPSTGTVGTTTYYVSAKSNAGCEGPRAAITVNVNALPTISGTLTACAGVPDTLTGSASADTTTPWASSDTTVAKISKTGIVTGIAGGTATITYKNLNGCTATATFTVKAMPAALSVTTPVTYCQDATTSALTAPTGTSIKWYTVPTGGTASTTVPTPVSTVPGIIPYYVTQTNGLGCENIPRTVINVVINPKPAAVTVTAATTSLCNGDSVVLNGSSSIFNGFGNTSFLKGTATGTTNTCDCPNGSVVVGYEGGTGAWIDHFDMICKPIDRFGNLGSTTTPTTTNGTSPGPTAVGPYLFSGTGMLVGMNAKNESYTPGNFLGGITGYGQNASYITALGDNTSGASSLTAIGGWSAASNLGTVWAPNGTVVTGMYSYNLFYAGAVSLRYTPIGAFKYNYSWSTGDTNKNITVKTTGTYTLTVTNSLGCAASSTPLTITVNPLPTVTGTLNACVGLTSTLTGSATPNPTAPWTSSDSTIAKVSSAGVVTGIAAGTVTITYKNSNGCNTTVTFTVNGLPGKPTVSTPVTYCQGATATVLSATKANPADTLYWYNSATGGTGSTVAPTPSTTAAGTTLYYVSERNASKCDGARATITVNVNPTPVAPVVVAPVTYCQGTTATALSATKATSTDTLLWYTTATGGAGALTAPTPSTGTVGTTTYYVSAKSNAGCEGPRAAITVTINPTPTAPVVTTPVAYCVGATATALTATKLSTTDTIFWYTVATGGTSSTTAPTPGTATAGTTLYYASLKTSLGCEGPRSAITVNVNALPSAPTVVTPVNLCVGGSSSALTATGTGLKWYNAATGGTGSSTAPTPGTSVVGSTTYYVSQTTSATGCEGPRAAIVVNVNALPTAPTVVTPVNLCFGGSSSALTATGTNLLWYTVATGGTSSATAPTPGTASVGSTIYYVTQTSAASVGSCESPRAAITVIVNPLPAAPVVSATLNLCIGGASSALSATGSNLKWYNVATGGTATTTAPIPSTSVLGTTNYYVSQTSAIGCEGPRATIAVTVQPLPVLTITPVGVPDFVFCDGRKVILKANAPTAISYQWQTLGSAILGAVSDTISTGTKRYYGVTVKDIYGCVKTDSVFVKDDPLPVPTLSPTGVQQCEGVSITLYCNPATVGYTYEWMKDGLPMAVSTSAANTPVILKGDYSVKVTDIYTCVKTTNVSTITNYPAVLKPTIIRFGTTLKLDKTYNRYQWYRNNKSIAGANGPTYIMLYDGAYFAEVTDVSECSNYSDTVQIASLGVQNVNTSNVSIKLYPNPTKSIVNIEAPIKVNVRVTNLVGAVVFEQKDATSVNLEQFADGTYFFRISDESDQLISIEKITKMAAEQ